MISSADPRLSPYHYTGTARRLEPVDVFIAEGEKIVRRLWASDYVCDTVLCAETKVGRIASDVPAGAELLVVTEATMHAVLGFKFHSGIMATGRRRPWPTAAAWLAGRTAVPVSADAPLTDVLLVLPEITDPLNLGAILRNAAAFGVGGVLLGERCRDPFSRQTIRTSMGTIFNLPLARSADLVADLATLKTAGYSTWATVLDDAAVPLPAAGRPRRIALLLGNEGPGLTAEAVAACDRRVMIPMQRGTDSLNVAAASAVFLYELTRANQE